MVERIIGLPNGYLLRVQDVRDAMQDLLTSPKGVVPHSAERFFANGCFSTYLVRNYLENGE